MATDDPAARWPHYREDDCILRNFVFTSGAMLPAWRLHYRTMGVPRRAAVGTIVNGVLLPQGNTGTGAKVQCRENHLSWSHFTTASIFATCTPSALTAFLIEQASISDFSLR